MRGLVTTSIIAIAISLVASAVSSAAPGGASGENPDFVLRDTGVAKAARDTKGSKIEPTKTEAAMRFVVIDKDKGPVKGVVIVMTSPGGDKYYTEETDAEGRAEVLAPVGQTYDVTYLSLGRKDVAATVTVTKEPKQNVKLTLRFKRLPPPPPFVLVGVNFDTGKATIRPESLSQLDQVVAFMAHKRRARVEISGHTDNVGKPKANKTLSENRANACRAYIASKGIDVGRIDVAGHGDERPVASNDTAEGRQKNRRMEAKELEEKPN